MKSLLFKGSILIILALTLIIPQKSYSIDDRYITECGALTKMTHAINAPSRGEIEGYAVRTKGSSRAKIVTSEGVILGLVNSTWQAIEGLELVDDANGITEIRSDISFWNIRRGDVFVSRANDIVEQYRIGKDDSYSLVQVFDLVTTVPVEDLVSGYPLTGGSIGIFDGSNVYQTSISGSQIIADDAHPADISALLSDLTGNVPALDSGKRKTLFAIDDEKLSQLKLDRALEVRGIRYGTLKPYWTAGRRLSIPRALHTATRLQDGRVLVVGGYDFVNGIVYSDAEIYDPLTGSWLSAGNLSIARGAHTATLLQDGRVLIAGGFSPHTSDTFSSAEIYDPVTNTWSITGNLNTARFYHTSNLLNDGRVLVAGGSSYTDEPFSSVEIYDPVVGTWSNAGSLNDARLEHSANLLPDGKVLIAGGYDSNYSALASAEIYDTEVDTWNYTGSLAYPRVDHTATLMNNGNVLVAGGWDSNVVPENIPAEAEFYDSVTETWSSAGYLNEARATHTATLLHSGKVLVAGGHNGFCPSAIYSTELYDPLTNTWTVTGSLKTARGHHTSTLLSDGRVLITGGDDICVWDYYPVFSSVELYHPAP
jgi:N-acetylneuraminic acid mutarotase